MCQIAKGYFEELFLENHSSCAPVIEVIEQVVYEEDNDFLTAPSQVQEFKDAMFSMHPDKCLGLDGFNLVFSSIFCLFCSLNIYHQ